MEISESLRCLFSAQIERQDGNYVVEIPDRELELGELTAGETYQVALLATPSESADPVAESSPAPDRGPPDQPVEEGEIRDVEIEDIGEQDDGIARVERGFVVIVPDSEKGERVTVEITDVRETVAFADVVERLSYYE